LSIDRDCDATRVIGGLNPNHFSRVTFRLDQCRLRANMQTLKRHILRSLVHAETGKRDWQVPFVFKLPPIKLLVSFGAESADAQCAEAVSARTPVSH
jgi:hypothetical protein